MTDHWVPLHPQDVGYAELVPVRFATHHDRGRTLQGLAARVGVWDGVGWVPHVQCLHTHRSVLSASYCAVTIIARLKAGKGPNEKWPWKPVGLEEEKTMTVHVALLEEQDEGARVIGVFTALDTAKVACETHAANEGMDEDALDWAPLAKTRRNRAIPSLKDTGGDGLYASTAYGGYLIIEQEIT